MEEDDEFEFNDADFDELPANTLQQLEASAILSTQHQNQAPVNPPQYVQHVPSADPAWNQAVYGGVSDVPQYDGGQAAPARHESDYGDDEVINLNDDSLPAVQVYDSNPPEFGNIPAAAYPQWAPAHENPQTETEPIYYPHQGNPYQNDSMNMERLTQRSQPDVHQLLARIKRLEQEKVRLNRDVQLERSKAASKAGEAEIVRRRLEAATTEHERKIAAVQQAQHEAAAKQKAELEKIRREREQIETNNLFLEHDLAREADKAKRARRVQKEATTSRSKSAAVSPSRTPKRQKSLPFRDGFDDQDVVMVSPSKSRDRQAMLTPKQGGKRKRQVPVDQSPIRPLELTGPRDGSKAPKPTISDMQLDPSVWDRWKKDDHHYILYHRLVNHRSSNGKDRVLEALAHHSFPSQPSKKLSSILYDEIASNAFEDDPQLLGIRLSHAFLTLWESCRAEAYYAPLDLILDGLQFILAWEPSSTAAEIRERAVPLIMAAVDLIAVPVGKVATNNPLPADWSSPEFNKLRREIDVMGCLDVLRSIAIGCALSPVAIDQFWRCLPNDFVLINLMKAQPYPQILLMLRILCTSRLPTTIGAIAPEGSAPDRQEKRQNDLLQRLTNLLFEVPMKPSPDGVPEDPLVPCTPEEIWTLKLQILDLLTAFSAPAHGSHALAHMIHGPTRLLRLLNATISGLYTAPLSPTHSQAVAGINKTLRLLRHLMKRHPEVDIRARVAAQPGGAHQWLVSLTRLAFSESDTVLEEGIDEDVKSKAFEILDQILSPEEGEALIKAYGSSAESQGREEGIWDVDNVDMEEPDEAQPDQQHEPQHETHDHGEAMDI